MALANHQTANKVKICDQTADDFDFRSKIEGPIGDMTMLQRSVLFAEVSMISYLEIGQCNIAAGQLGFSDGKFFNTNGAQAYWLQSEWDSVIVFRGTEPHEWNDIQADMNALKAVAETAGVVHRGFKSEVDGIWPHIEQAIADDKKPLWFCGHSLGGAMATIGAGRAALSEQVTSPQELYTYGSPRVGCKRYINFVKINHYRWVNNNDIVPRVPPAWLGYRHGGQEFYLDRLGRLRNLKGWRRVKDGIRGMLATLRRFRIDYLSDHSMLEYIANIDKARQQEDAADGS